MKNIKQYILFLMSFFMIIFYSNCEKEIDIDLPDPENAVVVEGHIENNMPPYVLLTKNSSFFGGINLNDLANYFISGASVKVIHQQDTITLKEYNYSNVNEMSDSLRNKMLFLLGLSVENDSGGIDILSAFALATIYTIDETMHPNFVGELGETYQLLIEVDGEIITATTTIPSYIVGFDSLWIEPHPNANFADEYFQLYGLLNDPPTTEYYRYFTFNQNNALHIPDNSVFDDAFYNGQKFEIFIPKGKRVGNSTNDVGLDETSGYWNIKDSILNVKFCIIDKAHYDFWRTLESSRNSQGNPFGSFVYVKSNIQGGLGIWGAYATKIQSYYRY